MIGCQFCSPTNIHKSDLPYCDGLKVQGCYECNSTLIIYLMSDASHITITTYMLRCMIKNIFFPFGDHPWVILNHPCWPYGVIQNGRWDFRNLVALRVLTHWGQVTHICVGNLTIIGSDNGLSPGRRQAIIFTNAGILLTGPLGTNFSEILIGIHKFSFTKMYLKISSAKWRPFSLGLNVLRYDKWLYQLFYMWCNPCSDFDGALVRQALKLDHG